MSGFLPLLAFVLGCVMLVLGITGMSHVRSSRVRRRHEVVFSLEEFLGYRATAARLREGRIEIMSRLLVVLGGVIGFVAYLRL